MPNRFKLQVKVDDDMSDSIKEYYYNQQSKKLTSTDSGLDLPLTKNYTLQNTERETFNFKIKCQMLDTTTDKCVPYYLYPRSSISKTPLVQTNSVGIIDKDYRGNIMGKVVCIETIDRNFDNDVIQTHKFNSGDRLFQLCSSDLSPFDLELVNELTLTERGEGGFGSTGKSI
jgi:dUTP pyrophosphatase